MCYPTDGVNKGISGAAFDRDVPLSDVFTAWVSGAKGIPSSSTSRARDLRSITVGAGFGSTVGSLLGTSIALAAILGMAGYFAGVVQAPMTAFVIILEMTGDHQAVIPIVAVSMIGYMISRILSREPLYHGLSRAFIAASIRARRPAEKEPESTRT
ncbi:voltage-gated chloride channel [Rhizobium sp. BK251]|nr:voltage-gated chloride channel [Rhizobium sp. BK251]